MTTDSAGEFCTEFQRPGTDAPLAFAVTYDGDEHTDPSSIHLDIDALREATELDWLNQRQVIDFEGRSANFDINLHVGKRPLGHQPLSLQIKTPQSNHSTEAFVRANETTDDTGTAHFRISEDRLQSAGAATLEVHFDGTPQFPSAQGNWTFLRVCNVTLTPTNRASQLARGDQADIAVSVTSTCHAPLGGIVEFSGGGRMLCQVSPLDGVAHCSIGTAQFPEGPLAITASYVSPSEVWKSRTNLHFTVVITPPKRTAAIFWLVATAAIVGWLLAKWRVATLGKLPNAHKRGKISAASSIEREPLDPGMSGWYGVVIDAHTGLGVSGARLRVEYPGFSDSEGYDTRSNSNGEFSFPELQRRDLSRIIATADHYSGGQWPLPPPGRLTIRLQTYRRAILQSFVAWFRARRGPSPIEPTPAEVVQDSAAAYAPEVIDWVRNIEQAAFGPNEPDQMSESLVSGPPTRHDLKRNH